MLGGNDFIHKGMIIDHSAILLDFLSVILSGNFEVCHIAYIFGLTTDLIIVNVTFDI